MRIRDRRKKKKEAEMDVDCRQNSMLNSHRGRGAKNVKPPSPLEAERRTPSADPFLQVLEPTIRKTLDGDGQEKS